MTDIHSIAAVGLAEGQRRLEAASLNAANAATPGYRRQVPATRDTAGRFEAAWASARLQAQAPHGVDPRAGPLLATGRTLDVAIESDGRYFGLTDGRTVWLTRAGSFRVDADGYLVGEQGLRVLGTGGDIRLDTADVEIQPDGRILRDGAVQAVLQLFAPSAGTLLVPGAGSLLAPQGGAEVADSPSRLRSRYLEGSNAGQAAEMLGLVGLMRQYEGLVRAFQAGDDALARTIQRLGDL